MDDKPIKAVENRREDGTFGPGNNANPKGRPKGQSLKEFWRQRFNNMTDEEKLEFSKKVAPELLFRMAEGNPMREQKVDAEVKVTPIYGGKSVSEHDSNQEDI